MIAVNYIDDAEVVQLGREIRFHEEFSPAGTNIIFVRLKKTVVRNPACPSGLLCRRIRQQVYFEIPVNAGKSIFKGKFPQGSKS
jgi:hypothetical protein